MDINSRNDYGWTVLSLSCFYGHQKLVETVLQQSHVNTELATVFGFTPLMFAIAEGHISIVSLLLDVGSKLDPQLDSATASMGLTPLMLACHKGHHQIVSLLLQRGAEYNAQCKLNGYTALMFMAASGTPPNTSTDNLPTWRAQIVKKLLNYGADLTVRNLAGKTACTIAEECENWEVAELLKQKIGRGDQEMEAMMNRMTVNSPVSEVESLVLFQSSVGVIRTIEPASEQQASRIDSIQSSSEGPTSSVRY